MSGTIDLIPRSQGGPLITPDFLDLVVNTALNAKASISQTATGSTTARTLPDRFADWPNIKDFGATGDGTGTGDIAAVNAIIALQTSGIGSAYLPPGRYANMTGVTPSPRAMVWIEGAGVSFVGGVHPPGSGMFVSYLGSTSRPWFTGPWGFGMNNTTTALGTSNSVIVQRSNSYTGSAGGISAAFNITDDVSGTVTTGEVACATIQTTDHGSQATTQVWQGVVLRDGFNATAPGQIRGFAITNKDITGRMSSVAGAQVTQEVHLFACGPDDGQTRIMYDSIFNIGAIVSSDGANGAYAGFQMRGTSAFATAVSGVVNVKRGISAITHTPLPGGIFQKTWVAYDRAFLNDCASVAFGAETGTQTANTLGSTALGATTIVLAAHTGTTGNFANGDIVTGHASIPAGTVVTGQSYDGSFNTTINISNPTTGTIPTNTIINVASKTDIGFHSSGQFTTAAMKLETQFGTEITALNGIWAGAATGSGKGVGTFNADSAYFVDGTQVVAARDTGWAAMTGTPDKATAFATSTVTLAQLAGRVMSLQAALTAHGIVGA